MRQEQKREKEIILIEGSRKMTLSDPQIKMQFAQRAAEVLMDLVKKTDAVIEIQGNKYLKFEGWQTLASFFGLSAGIEFISSLENQQGYRAKAVVYTRDGTIIGSAWGICSREEPGKETFSPTKLLAMAQTRAASRALKQILGWVATLGGFKETPAEEITETQNLEENTIRNNKKDNTVNRDISIKDILINNNNNNNNNNNIITERNNKKDNTVNRNISLNRDISSKDILINNNNNIITEKEINEIVPYWKDINPNYERFFKNKTQREAIKRMVSKVGKEKYIGIVRSLIISNQKQYFPVITSPLELEKKFAQLITYWQREKQKIPKIIEI